MAPRQMSLLASGSLSQPVDFERLDRTDLGQDAWIDFAPHWLPGADAWLEELTRVLQWSAASRPMYDRVVAVPRLITSMKRSSDSLPQCLKELALQFDEHYRRYFSSVGCNWYRDGDDSVAMHRDRIENKSDSVIAIVSVGERRTFLLKPDDGRQTKRFKLGDGDLLVMGGATQKYWQHAVPKVSNAGSRLCIMFRS